MTSSKYQQIACKVCTQVKATLSCNACNAPICLNCHRFSFFLVTSTQQHLPLQRCPPCDDQNKPPAFVKPKKEIVYKNS